MYTTEQTFEKFQIKVNENFETSKIAVDRGRFVIIFNEAQNKMVENILDMKKNDELRYIQKLLVKDKKILKNSSTQTADLFPLPTDYFDFSSAFTKATKGSCENKTVTLFEIKDDNSTEILSDEFNKPSFIAREAPFTFSSDKLVAFKEDFTHESLLLSYYRYPLQIGLVNPDNPESNFTSVNPEFDNKFVDRIISMAVSEFEINIENPKYQINKQQAIQKL